MKILAIDTSSHVMGTAVSSENGILAEYITNFKKNHSLRLMPAVHQMMKEVDMAPEELDAVAAAKGPGSYTGVRIGVTTAKTMAWSLGIPVYGISSLMQLAAGGTWFPGLICPFADARRGRVYTGLYRFRNGILTTERSDRVTSLDDWLEKLNETEKPVLFLSRDSKQHESAIRDTLGERAVFGGDAENRPRPSDLISLTAQMEPQPPHSLVPEYAQMAEAEKKWYAAEEGRTYE
ncbi:tRNA (adenosine(37)-N6)-threonylcarbamoyltransferase complex dimerization subunit type 1 TsaB [Salibacterium halotolerans]|uniref:tRNA threonylcarbamoyladenosine biosynthesis protein TsaB n=1 Tax=Salibacterium halotolerans TaxID=1884432 RepID=A0A1I5P9D0_9BACI|nr:tRNA (adenosine(37)-N6)-threonylcarbamoyltransferase complex dimerization subunit type 1 TsaB [Salibacterium halotolerans]SFP30121.1 tRNA threonylcarbamoyladenosine biosynthesis protein TsaB [Salibacterium halotolerans]